MVESKGNVSEKGTIVRSFVASGAITEGDLVEYTTTAGTVIACSAKETTKVAGVAITTAATTELVSVQQTGVVVLNGRYNGSVQYTTAIVAGENLWVGADASDTSGIAGQVVVHAATDGSTTGDHNTDYRKIIGIAEAPVSSTDTSTAIKVLLTL